MTKRAPSLDEVVAALADATRRGPPAEVARRADTLDAGVYAWWVDADGAADLTTGLGLAVKSGLIYAGLAGAGTSSATLGSRIRGNHLGRSIRASTFRYTLAAVLRSSLRLEPAGAGRMTEDGESRLTEWMLAHLELSIVGYPDRGGLDAFESALLERIDPPLNLAKRPPTPIRARLTELRRPFSRRTSSAVSARPPRQGRSLTSSASPNLPGTYTPEALARELGMPNAKSVRAFLRRKFPRAASQHGARWDALRPDMEAAVRSQFGGRQANESPTLPRATRLIAWSVSGDGASRENGWLEWAGDGWRSAGAAEFFLEGFHAGLPTATGVRKVDPNEGVSFLYAVWYSMRATYMGVSLVDATGSELSRDDCLEDILLLG